MREPRCVDRRLPFAQRSAPAGGESSDNCSSKRLRSRYRRPCSGSRSRSSGSRLGDRLPGNGRFAGRSSHHSGVIQVFNRRQPPMRSALRWSSRRSSAFCRRCQATGRQLESDLRQLGGATGMQLGKMWTIAHRSAGRVRRRGSSTGVEERVPRVARCIQSADVPAHRTS